MGRGTCGKGTVSAGTASDKWGRKAFVDAVSGGERPRNEVLADALKLVRERKRRRRAAAWVQGC